MATADSAASSGGVRTARPPRHRRHHAARSPASRCSSIAAGQCADDAVDPRPGRGRLTRPPGREPHRAAGGRRPSRPVAASRRRRPTIHRGAEGAPVDPTNPDGDCSARARMMLCFAREGRPPRGDACLPSNPIVRRQGPRRLLVGEGDSEQQPLVGQIRASAFWGSSCTDHAAAVHKASAPTLTLPPTRLRAPASLRSTGR